MNRVCVTVCVRKLDNIPIFINSGLFVTTRAARHGASNEETHYFGRIPRREVAKSHAPELLGPLLQVQNETFLELPPPCRNASYPWRRAVPPSRTRPRRRVEGTGPLPSSDAEASTDRAPRPAVWASTALSSGRVVVRGADVTGGKRGAAGRAGASRGRQPLPTSPREAAGERVQEATGGAGRLGRR